MSGCEFIMLLGGAKPCVGMKYLLLYMISVSVFAFIASCGLSPAKAHDWYPHECCHGGDCAPVDNVTRIVTAASGQTGLILKSKLGTALLPPNFPVRESKRPSHACMHASKLVRRNGCNLRIHPTEHVLRHVEPTVDRRRNSASSRS